MGAVEEALAEAEKHGDRSSEKLSALVAEAKTMIEQAKTEQAERARAVAEQAAAAAAVKAAAEAAEAAERLQVEAQLAALTLRMETRRTEGAADASSAGQQRRASCRTRGDAVRGVHGRAQESRGAAVHAHVRV